MAICQYFLRGQCKFGDQCRNEHPQDGRQKGGFGSQTWTNSSTPVAGSGFTPAAFTAESINKDLTPNIDKPLWPLTSYAPSKYSATVLTGLDESPEELRVKAALAAKNGTFNDYMQYETSKIAAAEQVFNTARSNPPGIFEQAQKIVNPSATSSTFTSGSTFGTNVNAPSAFGTTAQNSSAFATNPSAPSAFGSSSSFGSGSVSAFGKQTFGGVSAFGQSAFGQSTQPAATTSPFGQSACGQPTAGNAVTSAFGQPAPPSTSVFGQPTASVSAFGQSAFGQQTGSATSAFGQPSQSTASTFGQAQPTTSAFGQTAQPATTSVFGQPAQTPGNASAFGQSIPSVSAFGQTQPGTSTLAQPSQPTTSAFGQPAQTTSTFGQTAQPSAFGQSTFGQPGQSISAFGQTSAFGAAATKPAGSFGQASLVKPGSGAFGGNPLSGGAFSSFSGQQASVFGAGGNSDTTALSPGFGQSAFGSSAPSAFGTTTTPSAFGTPATPSAFGTAATPSSAASVFASTPAFGTTATAALSSSGPSIFSDIRVTVKPGADKHDALLPSNYLQMLPNGVREAFEAPSFTWGKVPEWIPPIELR